MDKKRHPQLSYKKNQLHIDGINFNNIAKKYSTPFYLYSESELENNFNRFLDAATIAKVQNPKICFALKSNSNPTLLKILAKLGAGADIVSGGELKRALEANIPANKIVFSGVGKTSSEIEYALRKNIYSFNIESVAELELINSIAKRLKKTARICFRLNPKVHVKTHKHISTGYKTHKFGILEKDILNALKMKSLWTNSKPIGLSIHIGSQLTCLKATKKAIKNMCECANKSKIKFEFLDVGGGLGIDYHIDNKAPSMDDYMKLVSSTIKKNYQYEIRTLFEPGRCIIATSGYFVSSVLRTKKSEGCNFAIVDGGMNDFVRPSLYSAFHEIYSSTKRNSKVKYDIVGPICETADCFGEARKLSKLNSNDLIVVADAGAYGYSMSSHYNLRDKPKEILLSKTNKLKEIRKDHPEFY